MESTQILRSYFKEQNQKTPDDFIMEDWTKREGLVWVKPHSLPKVLEKIWLGFEPRPTLMTHVGNDERNLGHGFALYLLFHFQGDFILTIGSREIEESYPSLTEICPALNWPEREVRDLLGVVPEGHPDLRPLVLHPGWPEGFHPLRKTLDLPSKGATLKNLAKDPTSKSCSSNEILSFTPQPLSFVEAQGEGTFEIPVGPIHAGIIEPGHFRFQTVGETILHLDAQLFYTHKGVEKLLEGKSLEEGLKIVERVCGVCSLSHSLAYCEAVEKIKGIHVSREVLAWRTVLAELERLYNHIGDIGNLCAGAGVALGTSNGLQSKEELQRLNQKIFGHRFLRGTVTIGGVRKIPSPKEVSYLQKRLHELEKDYEEWISLLIDHDGFRQRAITTGVLKTQSALDLGVTGIAARASGVHQDWRALHDHLLYGELQVEPQVEKEGDVWSRFMVRVRETRESFQILAQLLGELRGNSQETSSSKKVPSSPEERVLFHLSDSGLPFAWGCVESPRGMNVIWLMLDDEDKIYRCRIRSGPYANWPAVPLAVLGNIVPDFPLINKSFNLCYSCCDR